MADDESKKNGSFFFANPFVGNKTSCFSYVFPRDEVKGYQASAALWYTRGYASDKATVTAVLRHTLVVVHSVWSIRNGLSIN